jgi:hypothetical protein
MIFKRRRKLQMKRTSSKTNHVGYWKQKDGRKALMRPLMIVTEDLHSFKRWDTNLAWLLENQVK